MEILTLTLVGLLSVILFLYWFFTKNYNHWESHGVYSKKPTIFFGSIKDRALMKISIHEYFRDFYMEMKGKPYVGIYEGTRPVLVILDPELIKLILVKQFDHFMDRPIIKGKTEAYLNKILVVLKGNEWKTTRTACSPAFSSGRLKAMIPLFDTCAKQMVQYLNRVTAKNDGITLDIRKVMINYTLNSIASTSFGLNLDSYCDNNSEFTKNALAFQDVSLLKRIITILCILYEVPEWITTRLPLSFVNDESAQFFAKTIIQTRNHRLKNNIRRNDLLQLLLDAQAAPVEVIGDTHEKISNEKREILDEETAISQSVFFFLAAFETTSTHLTMVCYELAKNQNVQEKSREEVLEYWSDDGLTYEAINSMCYLDMVMSESLRLYPPLPTLEREVTKPIVLNGLQLNSGAEIAIPITGLHLDPEYFPDPMLFKPERFSPEEKSKRNPYVYLPFGTGPRNCLGLRFAQINSKICIAYLLKHYAINICDQTPLPFAYDPAAFFLKSKDDIVLQLTKII
ncbi:hypothetical protein O3M35_012062 [Rhynocoris fuscipes]|uniref:Cytochrome P450 n=1 Tax=Rhynocoris fuscipes TaxID=488301 RepID=A0AAW1CSC6_9HEMI